MSAEPKTPASRHVRGGLRAHAWRCGCGVDVQRGWHDDETFRALIRQHRRHCEETR